MNEDSLDSLIHKSRSAITELLSRLSRQNRQILPSADTIDRSALSLASKIDHTLLKANATLSEIEQICQEARTHGFATVCVNSSWIPKVARLLDGSSSLPISVVGFPLGAASSVSKAFEARQAIADGAREIDMVIAIGPLKDRDYAAVFKDIEAVVAAAQPWPVKVILEVSALNTEEKIMACLLSQVAGAAFVKTSTGFGTSGATVEDVRLMRKVAGPEMGVKASGGVRTFEDAQRMLEAGADRIGASSSVSIVTHQQNAGAGY